MRNGPWARAVIERLETALDSIARRLRVEDGVAAIVLFGSYARGDFSRKSDVDLMIALWPMPAECRSEATRRVVDAISAIESEARLPMHLAPIVVDAGKGAELGSELLHELFTDGIILYGNASALAILQPAGLAPWTVVRFSLPGVSARDRVRLARRLHGSGGRAGVIRLLGLSLARGAALVPAMQARAVRDALDEAGARYDMIPVWREA